ncbi:MAG TPA: flagellar hook capping FlgD N-terminal domain-containing protein [Verrucomicrobiae bacterium]|nr:flagellar hook capping FlgD N-terminal domain-containing protein [Verrucomicrobiae bacterium]
MQVNATSNVTAGSTAADSSSSTDKTLSQADFLKLLVAQMTSQDPLNPTSNQDLLSQTVQLSTLQSNTSLQSIMTQLQSSQGLNQADALLGHNVTVQASATTTAQGVVSSIDVGSGTPMIVVDGVSYGLDKVLSISNSTQTSTP